MKDFVYKKLSVSPFWLIWQIAFVGWAIYLSIHRPSPGVSVGVLGLLAVVATFERDPSNFQRSIWIVIATALLIIEIHAITRDRSDNEDQQAAARAVNQSQFSITVQALQKAISDEEKQTANEKTQFKEEHNQFNQTLARFNDLANTETGGDSFFYLTFTELYGGRIFDVKAVRVGKYPIKGPWAIIIDFAKGEEFHDNHPANGPRMREGGAKLLADQYQSSQTPMKLPDFATRTISVNPYPIAALERTDFQQYTISLGANNGTWVEEVLMKLLPGPYLGEPPNPQNHHWTQATTVTAPGNPKPILSKIDRDYPLGPDGKPMNYGMRLKPAPK